MHYKAKTTILLFSLLFITPLFIQAEKEITPLPQQTINNNNNSSANPIIYNNNGPIFYIIKISYKYITKYCTKWLEDHLPNIDRGRMQELTKNFLYEKRYKIGAGLLACCHCSISALLVADHYFMTSNTLWAQWKSEYSFAQLCESSQQDLGRELILAIGQRNFNQINPTDAVHPLISFISSINMEIKRIERYITTAKAIKRCGLMRIFPTNDNKIGHAEKLFERAHFIKHIFLSWLAEHNFTKKQAKRN